MRLRYFIIFLSFFITLSLSAQEDYYWIGGTGIWADLTNWETASGSTPAEVPDAADNVIFNENSFTNPNDTVWIYTKNPQCKNMIWQNLDMPVAMAGGADSTVLSIYASLHFHPEMSNAYMGRIQFLSSNNGNTLTTEGNQFHNSIYFDGTGEWILMDTLKVFDTTDWVQRILDPEAENVQPDPVIYLQKGSLNTNGQTMIAEGFSASKQNTRHLTIETSDIFIVGGWSVNGSGMTLDADGSLITCRGEIANSNGDGENLVYHNALMMGPLGGFSASNVMAEFNFVHFLGSCVIDGANTEGAEGSYTIDTLIVDGFQGIPCEMTGPFNNIHYAWFGEYTGIESHDSYIHHLEFDLGCQIIGMDNHVDSMFVYNYDGTVSGRNDFDYAYFQSYSAIHGTEGNQNYFDHAVLAGDGFLMGLNTFEHLTLNSGFWYRFQADSLAQGGYYTGNFVQTITSQLDVMGGCEGGVSTLSSDYQTVQAYLDYQGAGINTEYLAIKDINNIGSPLIVDNGVDLLNNENITFNTLLPARDLYWVGGQGVWSDMEHWSTTSGTPIPGGVCPPSPRDNVFFDGGSGLNAADTVNIDVKYAQCNDMTWDGFTGTPVLTGAFNDIIGKDTNNIKMWGSLQFAENMDVQFSGYYYFVSEMDDDYETLKFSGQIINGRPIFDGEEGKWLLLDSLIAMSDTLFFRMGELHTNEQTIHSFNFFAGDTLDRVLNIENSLITVHQPNADAWTLNGYNVELMAEGSLIQAVGDAGLPPMACHIKSPSSYALEYYDIEFFVPQSMLKSEGWCIYHDVTYKGTGAEGRLVGAANINVLTFEEGADACLVENMDTINLVQAYGFQDTIKGGNHYIYEANFYNEGTIFGYNWVGEATFYEFGSVVMGNQVDYAKFYQNGLILGNNTFGTFVAEPGKKYYFQHDSLTIITEDFKVNGTCTAPIRLQSDSIGTQAYIRAEYDNVQVDYTSFRDLVAMEYNNSGNIPYIASNSVDLGNNENWYLLEQDNDTLYWIGNTGNWGDGNNWSYESGGLPIGCLPRELNTVVFDENSFLELADTVTIDIKNALCFSMLWTHSDAFQPVLAGDLGNDLFIYGDLLFSPSMDNQFLGKVFFDQLYVPQGSTANPNTITSNSKIFQNDIRFQGIGGTWILQDSLTMFVDLTNNIFRNIILEHGHLVTNGKNVYTGGLFSIYKNDRILNIMDSRIMINIKNNYSWLVNGENLSLVAEGSSIINTGEISWMRTYNGDYLKYHDVVLLGVLDSLVNSNNTVEYNVVKLNSFFDLLAGNYIADTVRINGTGSAMINNSVTNVVVISAEQGAIIDNHDINRVFVNQFGKIDGFNDIEYAIFYSDGEFRRENVFDTLILLPGSGNTFWFEEQKTQTVIDVLQIRGHQCQNIDLKSLNPNLYAYIKKDEGIVSGDFLNIWNVAATGDNSEFYAGINSTPQPNPANQPPGWIWDNAQGYIYGFGDGTDSFCEGEEYVISATNFNGDMNTLYFWDYATLPGDTSYTINAAGKYHVRVEYSPDCYYEDDIILSMEYPPDVQIDPGPYCEGEVIRLSINPGNGDYSYEWFNGETINGIEASTDFNYDDVWVKVTDNNNTCADSTNNDIFVEVVPVPEDYLGDDIFIDYEEVIVLDAGPGDTWSWTVDNPDIPIDTPDERYVNTSGELDTLLYTVTVRNFTGDFACEGVGEVLIAMYPFGACDLPTAFSPDGTGPEANEIFKIEGNGINSVVFQIYNRYGKMVFSTTNPNEGWDGTYEGIKQEQDVYTYYLKAIYFDGGVFEKKGNVTLLR
jgi:gliding motility-associated-like protein